MEKKSEVESESSQVFGSLPKERFWDGTYLYKYQGFWFRSILLESIVSFQKHFQAQNTDVIVSSIPKSGTTWLKAITFSILNRNLFPPKNSPLLTTNPHDLVPFLEINLYFRIKEYPNLQNLPQPRILATHVPYSVLPPSIKDSDCRIVYICRNPLDRLNSFWHFNSFLPTEVSKPTPSPMEDGLDMFFRDIEAYGPFWNHVLEYWKMSIERPDKVLFLKYEDLKEDTVGDIKRIALFLGFPFSEEEEKGGIIDEISSLCSFETLKNLGVNKSGEFDYGLPKTLHFRKGEVGDWVNYITPSMADRIRTHVQEKLGNSGLTFRFSETI